MLNLAEVTFVRTKIVDINFFFGVSGAFATRWRWRWWTSQIRIESHCWIQHKRLFWMKMGYSMLRILSKIWRFGFSYSVFCHECKEDTVKWNVWRYLSFFEGWGCRKRLEGTVACYGWRGLWSQTTGDGHVFFNCCH